MNGSLSGLNLKSNLLLLVLSNTLSNTNDIEEGIISIEAIGDYKDLIAKNGIFAIEIKLF